MINTVTFILPGAHSDDNGPIASGRVIETTSSAAGEIYTDTKGIEDRDTTNRLMINVWGLGSQADGNPDLLVADPAGTTAHTFK